MKSGRISVLLSCCFIVILAFCINVRAAGFDVEKAYQSVFVVYAGSSVGSGFALDADTIVTNAHVVGSETEIIVYSYDGSYYQANIIAIDRLLDVAALRVEGGAFTPLEIGDYEQAKTGDDIYAIGAPKSMDYTLTKGIISRKERKNNGYSYIQIDAAINEGNSGGPLLNDQGQVIGINSMKIKDAEGIGLAIPITAVLNFIENGEVVGEVKEEIPVYDGIQDNEDEQEIHVNRGDSGKDKLIIISAVVVASIISVLIVVILFKKNKDDDKPIDYSDRTDFEIDILEDKNGKE